ncbi:MAG: HlyD family efflux transporter periplasmic adaptor subunit [Xanthomonadales bacterium]|nr:HlyD family efflux transporter periplasmic adaptor subunit [Xanthomonadales bacterium]
MQLSKRIRHCFIITALALHATAAVGQQAVSALGRIEPQGGTIRVGAPSMPEAVSGALLRELTVAEGARVTAGQLLGVTDAVDVLTARERKAAAELELARRAADAARSKADEACVLADVAAQEAQRRTNLLARQLASQEETELAEGEAQALRASCIAARASTSVAETGIQVAQAELEIREAEVARAHIRAPLDGMVLDVIVRPGELIGAEGVLELAAVSRMVAVAEVYETDIARVRLGQRAQVDSDALDGPLEGTVDAIALKVHKQDEIGTDPAARKDARIIEVDILLDEPERAAALTNLQVEVVIQP